MVRRSLTAPTLGAHRPHFPRGGPGRQWMRRSRIAPILGTHQPRIPRGGPGRHWVLVQLQRLRSRCGLWNGRGRCVRPWVDGCIAGCWAGRGAGPRGARAHGSGTAELTSRELLQTIQLRDGGGPCHFGGQNAAALPAYVVRGSPTASTRAMQPLAYLWPLIVAIAILGHHGPVHDLHDRSRRLVGSGLRWSSLVGRVLAPAGTNSLGG